MSHPHVVAVVETSAKTGDGCKDLLFLAAEHANRYELNRSEVRQFWRTRLHPVYSSETQDGTVATDASA